MVTIVMLLFSVERNEFQQNIVLFKNTNSEFQALGIPKAIDIITLRKNRFQ